MQLDFILIRENTGEMVNCILVNSLLAISDSLFFSQASISSLDVIMTCCKPGYTLKDDMCAMNETLDGLFIKDDGAGEYFYIKVIPLK